MSMGGEMNVTCECGHGFRAWLWQSANVTASPELRERILAGEMNVVKCPSCGRSFHVEMPFLYHDLAKREWIWVYPLSYEKETGSIHNRVHQMWHNLKEKMPRDMRTILDEEYRVIVLFGMDALVYYLRGKERQIEEAASN